jgi:hypothetical protein
MGLLPNMTSMTTRDTVWIIFVRLSCALQTQQFEWPGSEEEEKKEKLAIGPSSGNGVEYKCRDWEAVYRFAVDHRVTDRKGILDAQALYGFEHNYLSLRGLC